MKKLLLFALILSGLSVDAQSLKDALYGGKLRLDSGAVIRKGDDLSSRIDTSTRKPIVVQKQVVTTDSAGTVTLVQTVDRALTVTDGSAAPVVAAKDNNAVWKDYMEEFIGTLKTEVLPSKKIKAGSYSVLVDYTIETDGSITVNSVSTSPGSDYLEEQVKNRLTLTTPQMTPLLSANGKPRKAAKKHTFTVMKN